MKLEEITITTPMIQLDQFLKWAGIAETGGHAKELVAEGIVSVNGEIAHERRKKLYPGDTVKVQETGFWKITTG